MKLNKRNSILFLIDTISCFLITVFFALQPHSVQASGSFHISQEINGEWVLKYVEPFEVQYSTKEFVLDSSNNIVKVQIEQKIISFGDIEQVTLNACGTKLTPEYARYVGSGVSVLEDISFDDHNVIVNHEMPIEIQWNIPDLCDENPILSLKANEYESLEENAFRFPILANSFETYEFRNNGSLIVDGKIDEVDGVLDATFSPFWLAGTGHPSNNAYMYFMDDEEYVYIAIDITLDNTNEFGFDWLKVITKNTLSGIEKIYKIDDFDDTYGKCAFGLTSKVSYNHQTCEIKIPKSEILSNKIDFFINYYGTAGGWDGLPPILSDITPESGSFINETNLNILFNTLESSRCRLSLSDESYTDMADDNILCDEGYGDYHNCLTPDLGEEGLKNVFIACYDYEGIEDDAITNEDLVYTLDTTPPSLSSFSLSSGTTLTTNSPTISFSLDENGDCWASTEDLSYNEMEGDVVECSGGGTQSISCTMGDLGLNGQKNIYISCQDTLGNQDTNMSNEDLVYTLLENNPPQKDYFYPESSSNITDPTPTITFNTDELATCRLSLSDESYDQMDNDVVCEGSETTSHSCTSPDLGIFGDKTIYISCTDGNGNKDTSISNSQLQYTFIPTHNSLATSILEFPEVDGTIYTTALNEDGSILYIGGSFQYIGDITGEENIYERSNLAAIDTQTYEILDWSPVTDGAVYTLDVAGANIYIGGAFSMVNETETGEFAKLNLNGTLDTNCLPNIHTYVEEGGGDPSTVYSIKTTEHYIYVGGSFNRIGNDEVQVSGLLRLANNISCTWDDTWNPSTDGTVYTLDVAGANIYIGGAFSMVNETETGEFAKLNLDGTLDTNCLPNIHTYININPSTVYSIKVTGEYIYVGGSFNRIGNDENQVLGLLRVANNSSCTWDESWQPELGLGNNVVKAICPSVDDIYIGGDLEVYSSFGKIDVLTALADPQWNPEINGSVLSCSLGTYGNYVGGSFNNVGQEDVLGLAAFPFDSTSPSGNVSINFGNTYSVSPNVTLSLSATDSSGVREMIICNNSSFTDCTWEIYKTTKSWMFDSTYGTKTVYVKFKNNAGNISEVYSDSIVLHTPSARITAIGEITDIPDKTPLTYYFTSTSASIKGVSQSGSTVYFVYDGKTYSTVADSNGNFSISLTVSQGSNTIQYYSKDTSENQSVTKTLNLIVGSSYFPNWLLEKLGLITTEQEEETPNQSPEQEQTPEIPGNEEPKEEESNGDIQILQFTDKEGNPLVSALVIIEGTEYYTDSNGEIKVLGLENGKKYKVKVEIDGVKYTSEVLGASGVDGSIKVTISEQDTSNGIDWKKILIYGGSGLLFIFFLILIFRRRKDKEE